LKYYQVHGTPPYIVLIASVCDLDGTLVGRQHVVVFGVKIPRMSSLDAKLRYINIPYEYEPVVAFSKQALDVKTEEYDHNHATYHTRRDAPIRFRRSTNDRIGYFSVRCAAGQCSIAVPVHTRPEWNHTQHVLVYDLVVSSDNGDSFCCLYSKYTEHNTSGKKRLVNLCVASVVRRKMVATGVLWSCPNGKQCYEPPRSELTVQRHLHWKPGQLIVTCNGVFRHMNSVWISRPEFFSNPEAIRGKSLFVRRYKQDGSKWHVVGAAVANGCPSVILWDHGFQIIPSDTHTRLHTLSTRHYGRVLDGRWLDAERLWIFTEKAQLIIGALQPHSHSVEKLSWHTNLDVLVADAGLDHTRYVRTVWWDEGDRMLHLTGRKMRSFALPNTWEGVPLSDVTVLQIVCIHPSSVVLLVRATEQSMDRERGGSPEYPVRYDYYTLLWTEPDSV